MRAACDKAMQRPSRNAEIIYELVTANARDLAALRTPGCQVRVIRDRAEQAASPTMSVMPPKPEVN